MTKFKVISSTDPMFNSLELPLAVEGLQCGEQFFFMGKSLTVRQYGGGILTIASDTESITLQEVIEEGKLKEKTTITDPDDLQVNIEIDIFFDAKEIRLNFGRGNLTKEHGVTYDAIYRMLQKEWITISRAFPDRGFFPMEHEEGTNNYCFLDEWNWHEDYTLFLKDGCWSRKNKEGRHI